jgi:uncharacterized protein
MDELIDIEVAAGFAERQVLVTLRLPAGSTVTKAIKHTDLARRLPGHGVAEGCVGIFGRHCRLDQVLAPGDRVEIYRPLKADPKAVRRKLAEVAGKAR